MTRINLDYFKNSPNDDGHYPPAYSLTPKERDYLLYCEGMGVDNKEIRNDRIQTLDQRFEQLFHDIAVLEVAGVFSNEYDEWDDDWNWEETWTDILNTDRYLSHTYTGVLDYVEKDEKNKQLREFGIEIGRMLRCLTANSMSNTERQNILEGIVLGLMVNTQTKNATDLEDSFQDDMETIDETIEGLMKYFTQWKQMGQQEQRSMSIAIDNVKRRRRIKAECITEHGLVVTNTLEQTIDDTTDFSTALFPRNEDTIDQQEAEIAELVETIIDSTSIKELNGMGENIIADYRMMSKYPYQSEPLIKTLDTLYSESPITEDDFKSVDIGSMTFEKSQTQGRSVLNLLSGKSEEFDYRHWEEISSKYDYLTKRPVAKQKSESNWQLTAYGKVLGWYDKTQAKDFFECLHYVALTELSETGDDIHVPELDLEKDVKKNVRNALKETKSR